MSDSRRPDESEGPGALAGPAKSLHEPLHEPLQEPLHEPLQESLDASSAPSDRGPAPKTGTGAAWVALFRGTLLALAALLLFGLWRALQLHYLGAGIGNDVHLYRSYAGAWGAGAIPYVGFQPEYPPGALPLFLIPFLYVGAAGDYSRAFAIEMGVFDLTAFVLVLRWGRWLYPQRRSTWKAFLLGALYLTLSAALYPVLYTRFDIVPGTLVLAALTIAYTPHGSPADGANAGPAARSLWSPSLLSRSPWSLPLSAVVLGIAAAVKLWPLALAPTWLLLAYRRGRWPHVFTTSLGLAVGTALLVAPVLPLAGRNILRFLQYHADRGIEIGSTWASLALLLNLGGIYDAWTQHDFGAFHVKGPAADAYARWSTPLLPFAVLLPQVGAVFGRLGRPAPVDRLDPRAPGEEPDAAEGARVTLATVLAFMVFGKVLSPQFSLWLVPLLPLVCRNIVLALVALGIVVGTTVEYPFVAAALEMLAPGHTRAVLLVSARNALLIGLFVYLSWRVGWGALLLRGWARLRASRPTK